jgi:hypothetical protein
MAPCGTVVAIPRESDSSGEVVSMSLLVRDPDLGDEPLYEPVARRKGTVAVVLRPELILLAATSLGAAVLHAAFTPVHFAETWTHGLFFAALAWLQLALAVALIAAPSRRVFRLGLLNLGVIAVWIVSRRIGTPFGPNAWVAESVGTPDLVATGLEALTVLGCASLLLRSRRRGGFRVVSGPRGLVSGAVIGCVIVATASTIALTPRFATHTHGTVNTNGILETGHSHGGTGAAAATASGLTGNTPCEKSGPPVTDSQTTDSQGHNHRGPVEQIPIDQATSIELEAEQSRARAAALKYPTVADAEKAGYVMSAPYVPCIGAHYTNISLVGALNFDTPSELLYDGTTPDAKIVGLSYLIFSPNGEPAGFAGPNDHWHQHNSNGGLCFSNRSGSVIGGEQMSADQCTAIGGNKHELPGIWMLHDWVVPGWECSWGVFAPECPELGGTIGGSAWSK